MQNSSESGFMSEEVRKNQYPRPEHASFSEMKNPEESIEKFNKILNLVE